MPDKKLTDNEIKKAKELIKKLNKAYKDYYDTTKSMPYDIDETLRETAFCFENCLNEINRLQAENERLEFVRTRDAQRYEEKTSNQAHTNCVLYDLYDKAIKEVKELEGKLETAKAEAYKECIEKVKEYIDTHEHLSCEECECVPIGKDGLDNLLKELVGEDK